MSLNYAPLEEIEDNYYDESLMKRQQTDKFITDIQNFNNMHGIPLTGYEQYMEQYLHNDFMSPIEKERSLKPRTPKQTKKEQYTRKPELRELSNRVDRKKEVEHFTSDEHAELLEDLTEDSKCIRLIKHLSKCSKCRTLLQKKFPKTKQEKNKEEMLDVTIYILTGGFTLLMLDLLMKLKR
jgi:hypothetical protein